MSLSEERHGDMDVQATERLGVALETERTLTSRLLACLEAERASMIAGSIEDLHTACSQRSALIEELRGSQGVTIEALIDLSAHLGSTDPQSLTALIARLPRHERPRLRGLQGELTHLRRQVMALSEENRTCAAQALDFLDTAVSVLTGAEATRPAGYGDRRPKAGPAMLSSEV